MNQRVLGMLLTMLGGISWGVSGSIGQYLFDVEGFDSRWLTPVRLGCAGIILLVYSILRNPAQVLAPWRDRAERRELLVYGILGVSLCQFLYFTTIMLSTAGVATILQDLSPIIILGITCIVHRRGPKGLELLSIFLALAGVMLITTHGDFGSLMGSGGSGAVSPAALFTGIACAFTVVVYNVVPVHIMAKYPVSLLQGWAFLMGGMIFSFVFRIWEYHYTISILGFLGIAGVVVIGNLIAFPAYMKGVTLIGADKGILYGFSEPVTAAIIAAVLLGSPFTLADGIGFAAIFLMLVMISVTNRQSAPGFEDVPKRKKRNSPEKQGSRL